MKNYKEYLASPAWKAKREWALERAGRHCCLCCSTQQLDVHHNNYESVGAELPTDLVVLCRACHERHHGILPNIEKGQGDCAAVILEMHKEGMGEREIAHKLGINLFAVKRLIREASTELN